MKATKAIETTALAQAEAVGGHISYVCARRLCAAADDGTSFKGILKDALIELSEAVNQEHAPDALFEAFSDLFCLNVRMVPGG
jgi:hypothetical protein